MEPLGPRLTVVSRTFNGFSVLFHRYTWEHSEEDHSQAFPSTSGGQAAQHGFGVWETRASQEKESRFSWGGDGEILLKVLYTSLLGGRF